MKNKLVLLGGLIGLVYSSIASIIIYLWEMITGGMDPNLLGIIIMLPALPLLAILASVGPIIKNLFPNIVGSNERFILGLFIAIFIVTLIGTIIGFVVQRISGENEA